MILKLYLVIYLAGQIGGVIGPLPYGDGECGRRAAEMYGSLDQGVTTPEGYTAKDVEFKCEKHHVRPMQSAAR